MKKKFTVVIADVEMNVLTDAPTETVRNALFAAVKKTKNVLSDPGPSVYLYAYQDSAIEYSVRCWATCDDF